MITHAFFLSFFFKVGEQLPDDRTKGNLSFPIYVNDNFVKMLLYYLYKTSDRTVSG